MTMAQHGKAARLTIILGDADHYQHKPVYTEIVHRAHARGLAGASVFRGIEGFGASRHVHTTHILSLSEDLPVAVVIVDSADRIEEFLPELDELVAEGLVMIDEVDVVRYVGRGHAERD
jgi:uncharacterized protein